jgi:heme A synthase
MARETRSTRSEDAPGTAEAPARERRVQHEPASAAMTSVAVVCGVVGLLAAAASLLDVFQLLSGVLATVLGVAGAILGALAWSQARRNPGVTNGAPLAGMLLSIVAIVLGVLSVALVGAELQDLDATVSELQSEAEEFGEQVEEGAEDTADAADDAADELTD